MREKNLVIEDYGPANEKKAKAVLDKLLLTEELDLTVQWRFYERKLDKRLLTSLAEVIRERGRKKEFSVNMVIETNQWQRAGKLRKILNQYGFTLEPSKKDAVRACDRHGEGLPDLEKDQRSLLEAGCPCDYKGVQSEPGRVHRLV